MVKQAASATLADMSLGGVATNGLGSAGAISTASGQLVGSDSLVGQLAKLTTRTASEHARRQREQYINALDPDLAVYRSFALHAKISIQRKRDYWRGVENEKSWLQRRIEGVFDW
jgi:hypothetical protein